MPVISARVACFARLVVPAALIAFSAVASAADLTAVIENVKDSDGTVMVAVFDKAETFAHTQLQGQAVAASQRDANGEVRVVFTGLQPGKYAIAAIQDRDHNGRLSMNIVGMPTEPFGFSGSPSGRFGPPDFKDAAVDIPASGATVRIRIQ